MAGSCISFRIATVQMRLGAASRSQDTASDHQPFAVYHIHSARRSMMNLLTPYLGLDCADYRLVFNMGKVRTTSGRHGSRERRNRLSRSRYPVRCCLPIQEVEHTTAFDQPVDRDEVLKVRAHPSTAHHAIGVYIARDSALPSIRTDTRAGTARDDARVTPPIRIETNQNSTGCLSPDRGP